MSDLTLKVLVVDRENSEFLRSAVRIFDEAGFNVDFSSDWEFMQRKLKYSIRATDFLIIDLTCFQERDGYLLLMELREKKYSKGLKIILTTDTLVEELLRQVTPFLRRVFRPAAVDAETVMAAGENLLRA